MILSVKNLEIIDTKNQKTLVNKISFNIAENKFTALVGESGSGKTLTALSLAGLLGKNLESKGEIKIKNIPQNIIYATEEDLIKIRGKDIGFIFQEPMSSLNPLHTIGRQISEAIETHNRLSKRELTSRIAELLNSVQLSNFTDRLNQYPHQLSGGQRQRVMIAIAIANNPQILIADEPTTSLDRKVSMHIMELLKQIQVKYKISIFFISHDLSLVEKYADSLIIMKNGEIEETGSIRVLKKPKSKYTRKLINAEPEVLINKTKEQRDPILEIKNLNISYKKHNKIFSFNKENAEVLRNVNFKLSEAETIGILGNSGSGKTSLAMAVLRFLKCDGNIFFLGKEINSFSNKELRKNIQIVFQDPFESLNPRMRIFDIVAEGPRAQNSINEDELQESVSKVLKEVGLQDEVKLRFPHQLSGGQRQRVAIARAIILEPKILILDEPTSALDRTVQKKILELLSNIQKKKKISYILISHDLSVIHSLCHKYYYIDNNSIEEVKSYEKLVKKFA